MKTPRVLFILKQRSTSAGWSSDDYSAAKSGKQGLSSGLLNSATFVNQMLDQEGVITKLVQVVDNNCIDREVTLFKPTHVIIEALWVVPDKFDVLQKLHPTVKWVVRGHSEIPFLAQEGVALDWLCRYVDYENVSIATNSEASLRDLRNIIATAKPYWNRREVNEKVLYLPNWYPYDTKNPREKDGNDEYFDVACFGAIRPLKNQLIQAVAAIEYARIMGKTLRFHVNATRTEQKGDNVLKNLRALFSNMEHELVEHEWMSHDDFLKLLRKMDMGMQVTFTETFNIVAADMVVTGLPIVVSPEVTWVSSWCQAEPTSSEDIVMTMIKANDWRLRLALRVLNLRGLRKYCEDSRKEWLRFIR